MHHIMGTSLAFSHTVTCIFASYCTRTRTEHVLNAEFHAHARFRAVLPLYGFVLHNHACAVPQRRAQYSRQRSTPHHEVKFSSAHSHSTAVGNLRDAIRKSSLKDQIDITSSVDNISAGNPSNRQQNESVNNDSYGYVN